MTTLEPGAIYMVGKSGNLLLATDDSTLLWLTMNKGQVDCKSRPFQGTPHRSALTKITSVGMLYDIAQEIPEKS